MVNKMRIPRYINKIINRLQSNGYEAYIVGGAVRDYVLGKTPNDYDISTSALPKQIVALFKDYKIVTNGIKHGTVCVICENKFVEITTYRKDENYIDHRHPSSITFVDDLKIDLSRRDFTINALAYNTEVIDYFDGINDVKNGIIRAVGDANIRFEEDALRILRALRFSSIKGFTIEENTSRAMKEKKDLISFISKERIYNELSKIILGKNFNYVIINFNDILEVVFPFLKNISSNNLSLICSKIVKIKGFLPYRLALMIYFSYNIDNKSNLSNYNIDNIKNILIEMKMPKKIIYQTLDILLITNEENILDDYTIRKYLKKCNDSLIITSAIMIKNNENIKINKVKKIIEKNKEKCNNIVNLQIKGNDLISIGFKNEEISIILNELLDEVQKEELINSKEQLLAKSYEIFYRKE